MHRIFVIFALCVLFAGCASQMTVIPSNGKEDILSSKEIFLASLFAADNSVPYSKRLVVNFSKNKSSLTKNAKKLISDFVSSLFEYEDYDITVTVPYYEAEAAEKPKNLSDKRAQTLFKALMHFGADDDRIDISFITWNGTGSLSDFENSAVIDARVW